jgi:hypothetical protein
MTVTDGPIVGTAQMSSADLARASGLREDLVGRFIPGIPGPMGPLYGPNQVDLAVYVRGLTDRNVAPEIVDKRVRDFILSPTPGSPSPWRSRSMAVCAVVALAVGGIIGGLIGSGRDAGTSAPLPAAPATVTAAEPQFNIPTSPDPVCAEWAPISNLMAARQTDFSATDPRIPGSKWSPDRMEVVNAFIPALRANVADMRRLAGKANDPFLAGLMRAQATYAEEYLGRLGPQYEPSDQTLWQATIDFSAAVRSACTAVLPR